MTKTAAHKTQIVVEGVELTVEQTTVKKSVYVKVSRKAARDRKRRLDITNGIETRMEDALHLLDVLKRVAAFSTARCTRDYRYGYSDHAEHCQSIYVAKCDDGAGCDDD